MGQDMGLWETIGWGVFGGIVAELVELFEARQRLAHEIPYWLKSRIYWAITAAMILVGALLAVAYARSGASLTALLAINIGASAPLALRRLTGAVPKPAVPIDPSRVD